VVGALSLAGSDPEATTPTVEVDETSPEGAEELFSHPDGAMAANTMARAKSGIGFMGRFLASTGLRGGTGR
jgi:hypothetical protein